MALKERSDRILLHIRLNHLFPEPRAPAEASEFINQFFRETYAETFSPSVFRLHRATARIGATLLSRRFSHWFRLCLLLLRQFVRFFSRRCHNDLARKPLPLGRGGSADLLSKSLADTRRLRLLDLAVGDDPSPMLEGVCCLKHRSYLSELLTADRRARD